VEIDAGAAAGENRQALTRRLGRIAIWLGGIALVLSVLELIGVPVFAWIGDLLDRIGEVPTWAIVSGVLLESAQTSLAALAWYGILRAALPTHPFTRSPTASPPHPGRRRHPGDELGRPLRINLGSRRPPPTRSASS